MPNQSLTDLPERTTTSGSDRIHVNNAGTDYQQTKENFLQGDLYHTFDNTSLLTAQIDALPDMGTFFGRIASYGAQTVTGVPVNSNGDVYVQKFNGNYVVVDFHLIGNSDATYRKCKSGGTWESSWTQLPSRSEINSLSNSLANKSSIKYINGTEGVSFTIPANGYYQLQRPAAVQGKNVFSIAVVSWSSNTGAFWIVPYGTSTYDYVVGTSGVQVTNLRVRYWYLEG